MDFTSVVRAPTSAKLSGLNSSRGRSSAQTAWALAAIVLGGLLLRLAGLRNWSYWLDEAMQVGYVRGSLAETLRSVRFDGVHPPLDYLSSWLAFHLGGARESVLRLMPALWSALSCLAVFAMAGGPKRPARALGAAALLSATPLSVYMGQEVRPYGLALLLVACVFALLEEDGALASDRRFVAALVAGVLACLTLYLAVVPLAVLWASVLWRTGRGGTRDLVKRAVLLPVPALLSLGAWLWWVRASLVHPGERFPVDLSLVRLGMLGNGLLTWREETFRFLPGALVPAALILLGIVVSVRRRDGRHGTAFLASTFGVVALLAIASHWIALRYLTLALVPLSVLFGTGVEAVGRKSSRACVALLALFVALHVPSYLEITRSARPNWRQVAVWLAYQRENGRGGPVLGLDDWSYLCLRAQPDITDEVTGFLTANSAARGLAGEGWLVRTPHFRGAFDPEPLTRDVRPWATFPQAENARVYRVSSGGLRSP